MNTSEYPNGHWVLINPAYYQFVNNEVMSVYGIVEKHKDCQEGHYEWFYSARVCMNARLKDCNPISGYAPSLDAAKEIVETILHKTNTCQDN
jgi:hypothetical protein